MTTMKPTLEAKDDLFFGTVCLDVEEAALGVDKDGKVDVSEVKKIIGELRRKEEKEQRWRHYARYGGLLLLFSLASNFAMTWTT